MLNIRYQISIALFLMTINVFSQVNLPYEQNLTSYKQYFKDKYGVTISIPARFRDLDKYRVHWAVREDPEKHTGFIYGPFFLSKDKKCMIVFPSDFFGFFGSFEKYKTTELSTFYFHPKGQVTAEVETSLGLYYSPGDSRNKVIENVDLYNYVDFIFGKQAKEKYNADSYSVSNLPDAHKTYFVDESLEKLRKKKYPYCTSLFIQKDERAVLDIKLFFTKKGFKKKEKYINMLDKHIWFDEKFKPN
ncbi:hypothetical protein [Flavicella sediminum]|uniref:hypothetical protein n=1 Tax=Flavicella sediminum TaxID=2585141 RepID=UPI00111E145C|nr:hypothetical protein [Flavicella sediminum]